VSISPTHPTNQPETKWDALVSVPSCHSVCCVLQEHPSRQNSDEPVRAQQGWRSAVQRAEYGGLYAEPMPCDYQQRTECGLDQGYPFVSDCYALVGDNVSAFSYMERQANNSGPLVKLYMKRQAKTRITPCL